MLVEICTPLCGAFLKREPSAFFPFLIWKIVPPCAIAPSALIYLPKVIREEFYFYKKNSREDKNKLVLAPILNFFPRSADGGPGNTEVHEVHETPNCFYNFHMNARAHLRAFISLFLYKNPFLQNHQARNHQDIKNNLTIMFILGVGYTRQKNTFSLLL